MNVALLCHSSLSTQLIENYDQYHDRKLIHIQDMEFSTLSCMLSKDWLKSKKIDLVVSIGNAYQKSNFLQRLAKTCTIPFFLPNNGVANLEQSKITTKKILEKLKIPTSEYKIEKGKNLEKLDRPFVVKYDADYLLGKQTEIIDEKWEGSLSKPNFLEQDVLIEKFLIGEEFSYQVICNGHTSTFLGISKDHKRYKGYNTCGIASTSESIQENILEIDSYIQKILDFLSSIKISYNGIMYLNIMKVDSTYYVLEINTRFGEPETQSLYPTLSIDLFDLFYRSSTMQSLPKIKRTGNAGACLQLIHDDYSETRKENCNYPLLEWSNDVVFGSQLRWSKGNVFGSLTASGETVEIAIKKINNYLKDKYLGDFTYKKIW